MASLAESSLASVPIKELAALQEAMLNHRQLHASAPQVAEAASDTRTKHSHSHEVNANIDAPEEASAVIPDSADAYRTPQASSPNAPPPRLLSNKSAPPIEMETVVNASPSQEALNAMTRAQSFHGFEGGDTQPMDSQVYRNYTESMVMAKSHATTITPQKPSPNSKGTYDTTATGKTPHTYMEGETGFIDLENAYQPGSPARSATSGFDELLVSPQTQLQIAEGTQKRVMPETPAMAGHKRRASGEMVSSQSAATKKTPGFSQLFGAAAKGPVMSATQLFGQTQAPSSPMPDAPRSDPVITRPSPNMHERIVVSSPPAFRSSPVMSVHARPATFSGEPRENYTSMQESDERRRVREEREAQRHRIASVDEDDFLLDTQEEGPVMRRQPHQIQRVMSDQTLSEWSKMRVPARPMSRPGSSRKQPDTIDLITPATTRHRGEHLDFDDIEEDSDLEMEDGDRIEPEMEGDEEAGDEADEYDELAQTVLRSQPNDPEGDEDEDEPDQEASDDGHDAHEEFSTVRPEVHGLQELTNRPDASTEDSTEQKPDEPAKAVTATQRSAVADSQPLHQGKPVTSHVAPSPRSSFVPGSQYAGRTSVEQAVLRPSQRRRPRSISPDRLEKVPSSPPLPDASSTVPDGSIEASMARRQALAQFQKQPEIERKDPEREIPESDALVSDDLRPVTAQSTRLDLASHAGEDNSVPAPFSTARTHLSAAGPSPAKDNVGLGRSPVKAFASQHSRLSADSPRKRAGVRRFASIAADPSPPDEGLEGSLDLDSIMNGAITEEDQALFNALSSPVSATKATKRRKLNRNLSDRVFARSESPENTAKKLSQTVPQPHTGNKGVPEAAPAEDPEEADDGSVLRDSPSKANELPLSTPHNPDAAKSTQESTKKREKAGAAAVSQLLASRPTRSVRSTKFAGRGKKAAGFAEPDAEPAEKSIPKRLSLKNSNSGIKRSRKQSEAERYDDPEGQGTAIPQPDIEDATAAEPDATVQDLEPTRDSLSDPETMPVTAPRRVFALFKGGFNKFYPATWLGSSNDGKSHKVRFDDSTVTNIDAKQVRALDLRVGDHVKVDNKDTRNKVWTIKSFAVPARPEEAHLLGTDLYGRSVVNVQAKTSRNSLSAENKAAPGESDVLDVFVSDIYITHSLWPAFTDRAFTSPDTAGRDGFRLGTPTTGLQTPDAETPGSRARRKLAWTMKSSRKSHLREESVASSSTSGAGVFSGMAFAITYVSNETEKAEVTSQIQGNGGIILESGFDELFEQPDLDEPLTPTNADSGASKQVGLRLKAAYRHLGFVALIADRHSRRAKYMQALALGLPTLSGRWITDSLRAGADMPVPWAKYLLAAGESTYLHGAVCSRTLSVSDAVQTALADTIANRTKLLNGDNVLIVTSMKNKATWDKRKMYAFLTLALGAGNVQRVNDLAQARSMLTDGGEKWAWVNVDDSIAEASVTLFGQASTKTSKKRKRGDDSTAKQDVKAMSFASSDGDVKVVNDEFVVQSLILGALVD